MEHSWSPDRGLQITLPLIRGPYAADSSSDKGGSFLPRATASNSASRVSTPPRPPQHCSQQGPLTGWVVDMQGTKGGQQIVKGVPQQDQAQGQGLGISDLLSEVRLGPTTLPHHSEPSTPCPINRVRAAWTSVRGV